VTAPNTDKPKQAPGEPQPVPYCSCNPVPPLRYKDTVMIRKGIIALLTLAAAGSAIMSVVSHKTPLIYFSDKIDQPTFWKLETAQVERGMVRISFETMGEFEIITKDELPSGPLPSPPILRRPTTLRERLAAKGYYAKYSAGWAYGPGQDEAGRIFYVKALSRDIGLGTPAWFLVVILASYPTVVFLRAFARRCRHRKTHGLCLRCDYNLTGNESGVCPECGTPIEVGDRPGE